MKIATWNINGVKARIDNLRQWLADSSPDIACLQEVWIDLERDESAAGLVGEALGAEHRGAHRLDLDGIGFGNAVVSRWPITGGDVLALPRHLDKGHRYFSASATIGVIALMPVASRPMISFWIWEVPSYSVVTRASRR